MPMRRLLALLLCLLLVGLVAVPASAGDGEGDEYVPIAPAVDPAARHPPNMVIAAGTAAFLGDARDLDLVQPAVGIASSATGNGYWLVAGDGGIFSYGDAPFFGSMGGVRLNQPVMG